MTSESGIKTDLEVLLDLMLAPQYTYKMAKGRLHSPKEHMRIAARKQMDNALVEIEQLIRAYYNGRIRQVAEKVSKP